jgi:hypothetical protein
MHLPGTIYVKKEKGDNFSDMGFINFLINFLILRNVLVEISLGRCLISHATYLAGFIQLVLETAQSYRYRLIE